MKLIYPFINIFAVAVVSLISMLSIAVAERTVGLHTIYRVGDIETVIFILLYGGIVFNYLAKKFSIKDTSNSVTAGREHLYQSIGLYLICSYFFVQDFSGGGIEQVYLIIVGLVSLVGIVTNFVSLKISKESF
jgi:hypothetical protein